jgi:pentatricopeptide repeat protein
MLDGFVRSKQLESALTLIEKIDKKYKATTIIFNSLIDCFVKQDNLPTAWRVLNEMKERKITTDSFTYSTLLKGINQTNYEEYLDKSIELVQKAQADPSFTPDEILFNVLIDACIKCRKLNKALVVLKQMQEEGSKVNPDEITYNTIIKGCSLNKDLKAAFEFFEEMKLKGLHPNDVTYNTLIDCCVRSPNGMEKAWDLFTTMQDNGVVPDNFTFSTLIKGIKPS